MYLIPTGEVKGDRLRDILLASLVIMRISFSKMAKIVSEKSVPKVRIYSIREVERKRILGRSRIENKTTFHRQFVLGRNKEHRHLPILLGYPRRRNRSDACDLESIPSMLEEYEEDCFQKYQH